MYFHFYHSAAATRTKREKKKKEWTCDDLHSAGAALICTAFFAVVGLIYIGGLIAILVIGSIVVSAHGGPLGLSMGAGIAMVVVGAVFLNHLLYEYFKILNE